MDNQDPTCEQPSKKGIVNSNYCPQAGPDVPGASCAPNVGSAVGHKVSNVDLESGAGPQQANDDGWFDMLSEKAIRAKFVSKVFTILSVQLLITSVLIGVVTLSETCRTLLSTSLFLIVPIALSIFVVVYIVLICVESARRRSPFNLILLFALTFSYGIIAGFIAGEYETSSVFGAFLGTFASCVVIALIARSSKVDVTNWGLVLLCLCSVQLVVGFALVFAFPSCNTIHTIYASFGALLASLFLLFDLQLIMGNKQHKLSPEEYILACIIIYMDVVRIFLYLLRIFGSRR